MTTTASSSRNARPCWLAWNACAVPENPVLIVEGSVCRAAFWTSFTAAPRETPGGRLNDSVTDGNCPLWFTLNGPTSLDADATDVSGTSVPVCERKYSNWRAEGSRWYSGNSSIMTQYWLFGV